MSQGGNGGEGGEASFNNLAATSAIAVVTFIVILKTLFPSNSKTKYKKYEKQTSDHLSDYTGTKRTTDLTGTQEIRYAKTGVGSDKAKTIPELIREAVRRHGKKLAIDHQDMKGVTRTWTWEDYDRDVRRVAKSLISIGMKQFDTVNIIGFNAPEWIFADIGTMIAGCVPAGVYTTSKSGACEYIANHSKAQVLFVESWKHLDKYVEVARNIPSLRYAVIWAEDTKGRNDIGNGVKLMTWNDFLQLGNNVDDGTLENRMDQVDPGMAAALIYTSGTTGNPKAVMCSHDNLYYDAHSLHISAVEAGYDMNDKAQRIVSYLPLNHAAAKIADILLPLTWTATSMYPGSVFIARPDALKGSLVETMKRCEPTLFFGVPRVWEKFQEKMAAVGKTTPWPMSAISAYGKKLGLRWYNNSHIDGSGEIPWLWPLFDKTLFALVRKKLGLAKCSMMATGAAPMQDVTFQYFGSIGIQIINMYGMSENTGGATVNFGNNYGRGSAGQPLKGIDIKIDHDPQRDQPGNGEILIGGRANMMGYMNEPDKTVRTVDSDGYIHSGDVGKIVDGNLYITGRIKELIIGAGGENVAPVPIEHYIKSIRPGLSNVIMIGDKRKYNVCLVSLKTFVDPETMTPTSKLIGDAKDVSPNSSTVEEAMNDPLWEEYIKSAIIQYNKNDEVCVSSASRIQYFRILPEDLSVPKETLGPTLKVKRPNVVKAYADLIEEMY